jgi:CRP/FNR family transcriptional regulator
MAMAAIPQGRLPAGATIEKTAGPGVDRENLLNLYPALSSLLPARLARLMQAAALELPAGAHVFAERQPCQGFPLLLAGSIKVVKQSSSGRELMLYRVAPGGSCIITSSCLLGHSDYNARGIAESPLRLLLLPADLFGELMLEHAPFRDFVFHLFAERIGELMQLVEEVAFARLDQRLARLLLARGEGTISATHQQLADELGSVREIVSRLLKGFAAQGLVSLGREQIVVSDRDGLKGIAAV